MKKHTILFFLLCFIQLHAQETTTYKVHTIAFYNLENLYDVEDDPSIYDESSPMMELPEEIREEVYLQKLTNMSKVLVSIGAEVTGTAPSIIGVCEIENYKVLEDLVSQPSLRDKNYGIIQFNSPDRRGIDVALLYQKKIFTPIHSKTHELFIYDNNEITKRVYTRDQLVVSGMLEEDKIHIIVNHWPSRSGGEERSQPKRIKAARLNRSIIDSLFSEDPYAKIVTMGDFNDDPTSPSIKDVLKTKHLKDDLPFKQLYNPMETMHQKGLGSLAYRDGWNLFDQIIISSELLKKDYSSYRFYKAGIFNKTFLANPQGRFKGYPFRSFDDGGFTGGYSDHFPVYLFLIKQAEASD